jgi:hypothetical protein
MELDHTGGEVALARLQVDAAGDAEQAHGVGRAGVGKPALGYRSHGVNSPYLWAGSNHQEPGKYIADGVWDSSARDTQLGVMPVIMKIVELEPSLAFGDRVLFVESPPIIPAPINAIFLRAMRWSVTPTG